MNKYFSVALRGLGVGAATGVLVGASLNFLLGDTLWFVTGITTLQVAVAMGIVGGIFAVNFCLDDESKSDETARPTRQTSMKATVHPAHTSAVKSRRRRHKIHGHGAALQ